MSVRLWSQNSQNDGNNETGAGFVHSRRKTHNLQLYISARLEISSTLQGQKSVSLLSSIFLILAYTKRWMTVAIEINRKPKNKALFKVHLFSSDLIPASFHPIPTPSHLKYLRPFHKTVKQRVCCITLSIHRGSHYLTLPHV